MNDKNTKVRFTTFKYHSNGKISEERFQNTEIGIDRIEIFDDCGNLDKKIENGYTENYYNEYSDSCNFAKSGLIERKKVDTLSDKSIKITTNYGFKKTVEMLSKSGLKKSNEEYIYSKNNKSISSSEITIYNDLGQIIEEKTFYSGKENKDCGLSHGKPPDSYFHFKYLYYPNGFKKRYDSFDRNGKLDEYVEFEMEYYK